VNKTVERNNLTYLFTGEPTYWPPNRNKLLALIDFCIRKVIQKDSVIAQSCYGLSPYHSPALITLTIYPLNEEKQPSLSNKHTNWDQFRLLANERLTLNVPLKTEEDIETAVKLFNSTIQWTGWKATPEHIATTKANNCHILIKRKIEEKRRNF
jgi:hypothetical protein